MNRIAQIQLAPILIVEDEISDAELVKLELRRDGLRNEIVIIHTAALALDYLMRAGDYTALKKPLPVVTFLDIKLGVQNGLDLLETLRGYTATRLLNIVILTGVGTRRDKIRALELGANDYIEKPLTASKLNTLRAELRLGYGLINGTY